MSNFDHGNTQSTTTKDEQKVFPSGLASHFDDQNLTTMTDPKNEHHQATTSSNAGPMRTKRTRGPRSCLECRSAKQRCEQLNFAALVPSSYPQPPHMACRRCRVLQIACIVPDQLPKSTRLRLERSQSQSSGVRATTTGQPFEVGDHPTSSSREQWDAQPFTPMAANAHVQMHSQLPLNASAYQYPTQKSPMGMYSNYIGKPMHPIPNAGDSATFPDDQRGGFNIQSGQQSAMYSPGSSSAGGENARQSSHHSSEDMIGSSPGSQSRRKSMNRPAFEPHVFNPLPVLHGKSISTSLPNTNTSLYKSPVSHMRSGGEGAALQREESPSSHSAGMEQIADYPWFYRARISCRPTQMLEHLIEGNTGGSTSSPDHTHIPTLSGLPRLEDVVKHLASNQVWLPNVARRMAHIQGSIPFMPNFQSLFDEVEKTAFLIGVGMYLEGKMLEDDLRILRDHLANRSARCLERPPDTIYDICAIIIVANFCPMILPSSSLVGVMAGNALIFAAKQASYQLGHASAPAQLASNLELHLASPDQVPLPPVDSTLVQNSSLWVYLSLQEDMLELLDEPMPPRKGSSLESDFASSGRHPQASSSFRSMQDDSHGTTEDWRTTLERYCRLLIDIDAPDPTSFQQDESIRPPPSPPALRCASMMMLIFAARETETVRLAMRDFIAQFHDSILITPDSAIRASSLRRWTDQVIDALGMNMARAREGLKTLSTFLGTRGVVSANQLKYFELSLAALEFSGLSRLKDRLYVIGKTFFGVPRTSQEFLGAIFQRPLLLKSFEHSGVVRACVAKHVLTLFTTLALDLQPARRSTRSTLNVPLSASSSTASASGATPTMMGKSSSLFSAETKIRSGQIEPLTHWGALAHVFPIARWCGMLVCCATVLVEELAGRFMAQEAPWGASGESRLEIYQMLLRQTYDTLILLEEDAMMRYQPIGGELVGEGGENTSQESEQARIVQITVDSFEKTLAAISTWRKKASGVGQYGGALRPIDHVGAHVKQQQRQAQSPQQPVQHSTRFYENHSADLQAQQTLQTHQQQQFPHTHRLSVPNSMSEMPNSMESNSSRIRQSPLPTQVPFTSDGGGGMMNSTLQNSAGMTVNAEPQQQVQFGDALLHDILFTPIEHFFGSS
ncbi:uncharacterized protein FA14DRAFT_56134 [Meira miltonrushii]|uniref:Zn(2)-C6 fungal-type domain-containing protein n=1 Tax=Meira miltonrushii TaxID=1280837 RepID=A0A316VC63_9BASI|nr:uncharacterized protein FA14DRAFT_56134 [Meira miltonrushii]PWN33145.1 hypothetical protein FA14DRAFT_56134 [Meira miltonrushii]